jgi:Zn-dependent protease with chaperone function
MVLCIFEAGNWILPLFSARMSRRAFGPTWRSSVPVVAAILIIPLILTVVEEESSRSNTALLSEYQSSPVCGETARALLALADRNGIPHADLFVIDPSIATRIASTFSFPGRSSIAISGSALEEEDREVMLAIVAREMCHYNGLHGLGPKLITVLQYTYTMTVPGWRRPPRTAPLAGPSWQRLD